MHGLINRAIQCFVTDTRGPLVWASVRRTIGPALVDDGFEALETYDDSVTEATLAAAQDVLCIPRDMLLEDIGTYLVSHPRRERLRRLLRFGGSDFADFLHSLDDLPERARMALPDLYLPQLGLRAHASGRFTVICHSTMPGWGHVIVGVLRAMADDYGALAVLEHQGRTDDAETVAVTLLDLRFAAGRHFSLATGASG
ncbi:MAG: heme NO-binding domain-containing protein [Paracoccaceae bacterium]